MTTTTQFNVRLPNQIVTSATQYAKKHGFGNIQELIKESLREKLFPPELTKEELILIRKLAKVTKEKNLWGTEEELFTMLKR
ncbi:MAG: hypothetical protein ABIH82_04880 [Candidatus Woesearchaeota archaeon]